MDKLHAMWDVDPMLNRIQSEVQKLMRMHAEIGRAHV